MTRTRKTTSAPDAPWWKRLTNRMTGRGPALVPVVRLQGVIASEQRPNRINIASAAPLLKRAFAIKKAPVVAIIINSPGGSPVQSRLVSKLIRDLADEHEKTVLVFVEDVAASGGYFIAVAGDEIIADPSSIVGSIGVIMATFGFEEAIRKIGVTRRLYTAGKNKSTLDPFLPEKKTDIARIKTFETDIHHVFIDHVKSRRGDKISGRDDDLFTGEWWTGVRALDLGLIDTLGDMNETLKTRYGRDVKLKLIAPKRGLFALPPLPFSGRAGTQSLAGDVAATLEDRAVWSRFGL